MFDLFILAAEPSADLHGAKLIEQLLDIDPRLHIAAVSGPHMRKLPIRTLFPMEKLQVMGFLDVVAALPQMVRHFFHLRKEILALNPKAVVCIDYPGFNLRLARSLRRKGYRGKLIHFICPTVWAWGKQRIPLMAKNLDLLLTLFPFEKECFAHTSLPVCHVGHPLVQAIPRMESKREKILGIFPGSRKKEIERNFPLQLQVARQLAALDPELQIVVSVAQKDFEPNLRTLAPDVVLFPPEKNHELMQRARLALATSGTATLELALHETPTIVNYAIRPLDRFIAQRLLRINLPFYCIVNIVANQAVFPELFGPNLTQESLYEHGKELWFDDTVRKQCVEQCQHVRHLLGEQSASRAAAEAVLLRCVNGLKKALFD